MAPFPKRSVRWDTPARFPVQFSEMESAVAAAYLASSYPTDVAKVKKWISATINSTVVYHAEEIYDPMLGEATSGQHIVVGVSNHPRAIMPVSGTFFGEQSSYLGMQVAVQTARFVDSSP
jgi:hypothetical protein